MTSSPVSGEHAVAALFAERQQYEVWLSTLESKRAVTPNHIYDRVHADYQSRLQRTIEQLRAHRAAVQEMENALADRLTLLDIEEAKHRDERAEAELRALVGELTPEQCRVVVQRCDDAMVVLESGRTTVGAELARLRSVLDGPPSPQELPAAQAPGAEQPRRSGETAAVDARFMAEEERPNGASRGAFDELQFLKSVVEASSGAQDVVTSSADGRNNASADGGPQSGLTMPTSPVPSARATPPSPFESAGMRVPAVVEETRRGNGNGTQGSTAFLKDAPPEQVKSLKCQECGTLNYPTEWYCERCGAELAAL